MQEYYFKWILAGIASLSGVIRLAYELRYHTKPKYVAYNHRREVVLGLLFGACFLIPGLLYLFTDLLSFATWAVADELRIAAAIGMTLNAGFFLRIHVALGANWSPLLELGSGHTLVTAGPYRYIRHPMYACFFLHAAGAWILSANHVVGASGLLTFTVIYLIRVPSEEKMMTDHFGNRYRDYMARTGRLLPKLNISGS
jgi:protein-S-isoprenylcysteine O-methyltransferase Ste14